MKTPEGKSEYSPIFSSVRRGERRNSRNRKNCCRKRVLSSSGIYFRMRSRNPKIFCQNLWKSRLFIEILSKNLKIFFKSFKFLFLFLPNAQNFAHMLLIFRYLVDLIHQMWIILNFSTNYSWVSSKFARIFTLFPFVPCLSSILSKFCWAFW